MLVKFYRAAADGSLSLAEDGSFPRIDVGLAASPHAVDWVGDGRLDLLIGNADGQVKFFRIGSCAVATACAGSRGVCMPSGRCNCQAGYALNDCSGCDANYYTEVVSYLGRTCRACPGVVTSNSARSNASHDASSNGACAGRGQRNDDMTVQGVAMKRGLVPYWATRQTGNGSCTCNYPFHGRDKDGRATCDQGKCPATSEKVIDLRTKLLKCAPRTSGQVLSNGRCESCPLFHVAVFLPPVWPKPQCFPWAQYSVMVLAIVLCCVALGSYLWRRYIAYKKSDGAQRRKYRKRRKGSPDLSGEHLKLGFTMDAHRQILGMPHFSDVQGFRRNSLISLKLDWMTSESFFNPDATDFYGYELCQLAKTYVAEMNKHDHSVAELRYMDNDPGAGYANVFVSHYQGELAADILAAMDVYEKRHANSKYFLDIFCIRQGIKNDFQIDRVQNLICGIGVTLLVAKPWRNPETINRIWCVYEVFCTVQGEAEFLVAVGDRESLQNMQRDQSKHSELYEQVLEAMKQIRVENAQSRDPNDKKKIMDFIENGPGFLKTNLCVAAALTTAIQTELQTAAGESETINMVEKQNTDANNIDASIQQPLLGQV